MAAWPTLEALKLRVDQTGAEFDDELDDARQAAIEYVKEQVGDWDEATDQPDYRLSQAAMLIATRIAKAPGEAPSAVAQDIDFGRLMYGHRRRFGMA